MNKTTYYVLSDDLYVHLQATKIQNIKITAATSFL
jgi:hypothetical protein